MKPILKPAVHLAALGALLAFTLVADAGTPGRAPARVRAGTPRVARLPGARPASPSPSPAPGAEGRRLDDIHIEGEIAVPQVLFITARDQRRFMEFQNRRYLRTSSQLGEATVIPGWILVTPTPINAGKEIAR